MKKLLSAFLCLILCAGIFAGCGKDYKATESTLYVLKNGTVVCTDVEEFDETLYSLEDLETYVNEQISAYNDENGKGSVTLESVSVEEGKAVLVIKYKTRDDFTGFTGINLYVGTMAEALAAGYSFDGEFAAMNEDGTNASLSSASEFLTDASYNVAIVDAAYNVNVYGSVYYFSAEHSAVVDKNTVGFGLNLGMFASEEETETQEQETEEAVVDTEAGEATDSASDGSVGEDEWDFSEEAQQEVVPEFVFDETTTESVVQPKLGNVIIIFK